jgi:hypothetical protein
MRNILPFAHNLDTTPWFSNQDLTNIPADSLYLPVLTDINKTAQGEDNKNDHMNASVFAAGVVANALDENHKSNSDICAAWNRLNYLIMDQRSTTTIRLIYIILCSCIKQVIQLKQYWYRYKRLPVRIQRIRRSDTVDQTIVPWISQRQL